MTLVPGTRFGPYEIVAPLGKGGMGEVYRARDTRLGRDVALKVLPQHLSASPELRSRFEREAKTISSLNHPNICVLFDVGRVPGEAGSDTTDYLVMELVEGETLAERLARGALPTGEALKLGIQLADALDRAHRAGVIHRDLKPGNVMLTRSGAKLMDFGLARATGLAGGSSASIGGLTQSPTLAQPLTAEGTIVGTFQYMAPEQLEGREADARSDLWSLGCVLYEMATGRRAFDGRSQASLISAIMSGEPAPIAPLTGEAAAGGSRAALDRAVRQCLAKDPDDRWQNAGDLKRELDWIQAQGSQSGLTRPSGAARPRAHAALIAWAALATVLAAGLAWRQWRSPALSGAAHLSMRVPPGLRLSDVSSDIAISPDGRNVAFCAADSSGVWSLWIRSLDSPEPRPVPESQAAERPFWSPDGRWIAFFISSSNPGGERPRLMKAPVDGGPPTTLCDIEWTRGGAWGSKGDILFVPTPQSPIFRISPSGGAVTQVTQLDTTIHETSQRYPSFLPDGDHFVYASLPHGPEGYLIRVASLHSKQVKTIGAAESGVTFVEPGYLAYERERRLVARRLDLSRLELTGEVIPLAPAPPGTAEDASRVATGSRNGTIALLDRALPTTHLEWLDRSGHSLGRIPLASADYYFCLISPDERRAALAAAASGFRSQMMVVDLARGTMSRLLDTPAENNPGAWSPDGKRIDFNTTISGREEIFEIAADGTGEARHIPTSDSQFKAAQSRSPDGRTLVYFSMSPATSFDIFALDLQSGAAPRPLVVGPGAQQGARISPDGQWLAYTSDETGSTQIFVCSMKDGGDKVQVTTAGGIYPFWNRDGSELVFLGNDTRTMYAVSFKPGGDTAPGKARALFRLAEQVSASPSWSYASASDRFLMLLPDAADREPAVTLILDWPRLLEKR